MEKNQKFSALGALFGEWLDASDVQTLERWM